MLSICRLIYIAYQFEHTHWYTEYTSLYIYSVWYADGTLSYTSIPVNV